MTIITDTDKVFMYYEAEYTRSSGAYGHNCSLCSRY